MLSQEVENSLNMGFDQGKDKLEFQNQAMNYNLNSDWQARTISRLSKILKDTTREKVDLKLQVIYMYINFFFSPTFYFLYNIA